MFGEMMVSQNSRDSRVYRLTFVRLKAYINLNCFDMYAFKIACWALIFIFRLRFPSGVSIATILKQLAVFFRCIWSEFLEKSDTIFPQLVMLLTRSGLACEVPDSCLDRSPASYLVPWYFPEKRPKSLDHNWTPLADSRQVLIGMKGKNKRVWTTLSV